jgi:GntR family transcriptional regulator
MKKPDDINTPYEQYPIGTTERINKCVDHRSGMVYLCLLEHTDKNGKCFPSITTMSRETNCCRETIMQSLATLVKVGFISVETKGRGRSNVYTITSPFLLDTSLQCRLPKKESSLQHRLLNQSTQQTTIDSNQSTVQTTVVYNIDSNQISDSSIPKGIELNQIHTGADTEPDIDILPEVPGVRSVALPKKRVIEEDDSESSIDDSLPF